MVMFIIYINNVDIGLNNLIHKFADDTKIGDSVLSDEDRQGLQEDSHKISVSSNRFKLNICQVQVGMRRLNKECVARNSKAFKYVKNQGVKVVKP